MTDREMLEMAAKAAGMIPQEFDGNDAFMDGVLERWNPRHDDGDALRLAVSLCFTVERWKSSVEIKIGRDVIHREVSFGELNAYELTRLAITRAAAQIGKSMP